LSTVKAHLTSLPFQLKRRIGSNWVLYFNAGSLVATTAVTSGLGFIYWWVAARLFPQQSVGFGSAAVSAMMLLGAFGMLGLGTLIITEVGRERHKVGAFTMTAIVLVGGVSALLGVLFALAAPILTAELAPLSASPENIILFASGVSLTSVTLIVDQVMIALLRGGLQLARNILFAVAKLGILYGIAMLAAEKTGMNIYTAWMMGNAVSLAAIAIFLIAKRIRILYRPQFGFIRHLGSAALAHHATNLILQTPSLIMPIAVTTLLSAAANASFYASWMVASFVFVLPAHLTTVLHAIGAQSPAAITAKMRSTMRLAFLVALPISAALFVGAGLLLSIFGDEYVQQATWSLRILSLCVFPLIIKYHYIAILRIYSKVQSAIIFLFFVSLMEIIFAVAGLELGALTGLSIGWFLAVCLESILMYFKLEQMLRNPPTVHVQA